MECINECTCCMAERDMGYELPKCKHPIDVKRRNRYLARERVKLNRQLYLESERGRQKKREQNRRYYKKHKAELKAKRESAKGDGYDTDVIEYYLEKNLLDN